MSKQIVVRIEESGECVIEAIGFRGNACEKATEAIERAMGAPSGPKKRKPEYYNLNTQGKQVRQ